MLYGSGTSFLSFFCTGSPSGTNTLASVFRTRTDHLKIGHSEVLCDPRAQLSTAVIGLALRGPIFAAQGVTLRPQHYIR